MANGKGIFAWLSEHWLLTAGAVGAGVFLFSKRASASPSHAAVLASVPPAQQPAIQAALDAGAPPVDIQSALNAGVAPSTIATVAVDAKEAGGDVADRILAFVEAHPNATNAEIQAAVSGRHIVDPGIFRNPFRS